MKRDNNTNNLYFSPPSPNTTFNPNNHRPHQKESLPLSQFLPPNTNEYQHRYSNNIDKAHSNNAFAHLRHQISNLRSEFTKLIQKDPIHEKPKDEKLHLSSNKRQQRVTAQSTIGFYNGQGQSKNGMKLQNKGENPYFKNKLAVNAMQTLQGLRGKKQQGKYQKKYSFQIQQRRDDNVSIQIIDSTKIHQLEIQIRKLGQLKHKSDQENLYLKKELIKIQKQLQSKTNALEAQRQKLTNEIEQINISLSLKNSLVQKLETEHEHFRKSLIISSAEKEKMQAEIQACKSKIETLEVNHKNEIDNIYSKHEQQIADLELIHQKDISGILQRFKQCQESQRKAHFNWLQKEDEYTKAKLEVQKHQGMIKNQTLVIEQIQKTINSLKEQYEQVNEKYITLQVKYQQQLIQPKVGLGKEEIDSKVKLIEDENNDLKKRVQSYKKTVEQLNVSNNSTRQKLMMSKEQNKKLKEESKYKGQQLQVKQKLITSLYRDINILDAEIRHNTHLKSVLSSHMKLIDELNQKIMQLQWQRLNTNLKGMAQSIQQTL